SSKGSHAHSPVRCLSRGLGTTAGRSSIPSLREILLVSHRELRVEIWTPARACAVRGPIFIGKYPPRRRREEDRGGERFDLERTQRPPSPGHPDSGSRSRYGLPRQDPAREANT